MGENGQNSDEPKRPKKPRRPKKKTGGKRRRKPHAVSDVLTQERTMQAVALRRQGLSFREIGKRMKLHHTAVYARVQEALREIRAQREKDAEEVLELELARLDRIVEKLDPELNRKDGEAVTRAARVLIRASESRRRLLGLDAPVELSGPEGAPIPVGGALIILPAKDDGGASSTTANALCWTGLRNAERSPRSARR